MMRTFVVGITGHRLNKIPAERIARVKQELSSVFAQIEAVCAEQRPKSEAAHVGSPHRVRLVSSLAEGADQIAVFVRPKGWELEAVLPFPRVRYLNDFTPERATGGVDRRPEFEAALAQARTIVELPDECDAPSAYERAGKYILQQCHLLVAVWDGMPGEGIGGTKAIVTFAIDACIPVIWIRTDRDQAPTLITAGESTEHGLNSVAATKASIAEAVVAALAPATVRKSAVVGAGEQATQRDAHLFGPGPKRILSLDGGGVRGVATLAFLEKLETQISEIEGRPTRLADWFDLIGGTSTGSIIAAALALGFSASEIHDFYRQLAPRIFKRSYFRLLGWQAKFDSSSLMQELATIIGDRTLDSTDVLTGLCILLKRMDTGSAWMVMNNPRSVYWETPADRSFIGNRHLPIANLVRASTAAPGFFDPELIEIVAGQPKGLFIDGGLTPHNNPALMMLMAALLPIYGLNWKLGPENLMIVSVGTGSFRETMSSLEAMRLSALGLAMRSLFAMIHESEQLVLRLMTYLGESPLEWPINSEVGDLGQVVAPTGNLFRFLRYDLKLEQQWLEQKLGENLPDELIGRLRQMDQPGSMSKLYELGQKAAALQIKREHLEMPGGDGAAATVRASGVLSSNQVDPSKRP